jgi:hypothetical protein
VQQYLQQVDCFLELLIGCVHVKCGQLGQGLEITIMQHCNRLLQDQNIFIVDSAVMTVVCYHKSQLQWDKLKVVLHFLLLKLGQIIALYLSYL